MPANVSVFQLVDILPATAFGIGQPSVSLLFRLKYCDKTSQGVAPVSFVAVHFPVGERLCSFCIISLNSTVIYKSRNNFLIYSMFSEVY